MLTLIDSALQKAYEILGSECSPIRLMASPEGYPHVWARDSVITSLGALHSLGHENCLRVSLQTLAGQQSELGAIPNNVSVATGRLDHTNTGSAASCNRQRRISGGPNPDTTLRRKSPAVGNRVPGSGASNS